MAAIARGVRRGEPGAGATAERESPAATSAKRRKSHGRGEFPSPQPPSTLPPQRSESPSFEDDFGVSKETLLHGSYADYIKEYSARSSRSSGGQSVGLSPAQVGILGGPK